MKKEIREFLDEGKNVVFGNPNEEAAYDRKLNIYLTEAKLENTKWATRGRIAIAIFSFDEVVVGVLNLR